MYCDLKRNCHRIVCRNRYYCCDYRLVLYCFVLKARAAVSTPMNALKVRDQNICHLKFYKYLRSAQTRKHCCRNILSQCCSQCCMGAQTGKKQNFFASETQIPRLQDMLLGYANEETFGKHSKSVFLQCFPSDSSRVCSPTQHMLKTQNLRLESKKNAFQIFQKHFLHPGRIFASATMFPCLRRPLGVTLDLTLTLSHYLFNPISPGRFNTFSTWGRGPNLLPSLFCFPLSKSNQIWCGDSPS